MPSCMEALLKDLYRRTWKEKRPQKMVQGSVSPEKQVRIAPMAPRGE
jgi:hypothetical protein